MTGTVSDIDFRAMANLCFGHSARRTANLLTRHYNAHLAPLGLELTQAQLLAVVAEGSAESAAQIARVLGIERSTLARNLKPLEAKGWITRAPTTRRKVVPALTPEGEQMVVRLHNTWLRAQAALTAELGEDAGAAIRENMSTLRQAVRALDKNGSKPAPLAEPNTADKDNARGKTHDRS